jgi:hypothetical protein
MKSIDDYDDDNAVVDHMFIFRKRCKGGRSIVLFFSLLLFALFISLTHFVSVIVLFSLRYMLYMITITITFLHHLCHVCHHFLSFFLSFFLVSHISFCYFDNKLNLRINQKCIYLYIYWPKRINLYHYICATNKK